MIRSKRGKRFFGINTKERVFSEINEHTESNTNGNSKSWIDDYGQSYCRGNLNFHCSYCGEHSE
jgi:hypothetical protein